MIHANILSLIGQTPLVSLDRFSARPNVKILAKVESVNPGGSIKDRVALAMIETAERNGEIGPGKTVIEATSGNTGIGLAMVCAVKGYKLKLLMPETASEERKRIMRALGAEIVLTEGRLGTDGAIEEAYRLAREEPDKYALMDQFNNPAGITAHYLGTAKEIWDQTKGKVTHAVAALGTTGTAMGLVSRLKELNPEIAVVAVEPYAGHKIQGLKNMQESYPPGIFDRKRLDKVLRVEDEEAFELCRELASKEGLFVGMSSGAALAGALRLVREMPEDREALVVVVFPDGGERYLSTNLFASRAEQGLKLRDAATDKEAFLVPGEKQTCLYTVGPSLDTGGDLEFWRRLVLLDVLRAYLTASGAKVRVRAGLADMDDRAVKAAREAGISRLKFVERILEEINALAASMRMDIDGGGVSFVPAGPHQEKALSLCVKLLSRGLAYEKLRSVYFDVFRDKDYGRMGSMDVEKLSLGRTVDLAAYVKDNPQDFTLLKRAALQDVKEGEFWQTEWGSVRPSWFLQMAVSALDAPCKVDVFLAGEAHLFPHMENLRALWWFGSEIKPKVWMACRSVAVHDLPEESGGESGFVRDATLGRLLSQGVSVGVIRMWLLSASHHKALDFSEPTLRMWTKNQRKVQDLAAALKGVASADLDRAGKVGPEVEQFLVVLKKAFKDAVEDDVSLHKFWPVLFKFCRDIKNRMAGEAVSSAEAAACLKRIKSLDSVLQIVDWDAMPLERATGSEEVDRLVHEREAARKAKDFALADELREKIFKAGYRIEDGPDGVRLYPEK